MATPKNVEHVPDAHLLDDDDEGFDVGVNEDDLRIIAQTPRHGKQIRMSSPPPRSPESDDDDEDTQQATTPPRQLTSPTTTPTTRSERLRYVCKTNVHVYTMEQPTPRKVTSGEFTTHPNYFNQRNSLENLITRARILLMRQEPFQTLLTQGYDYSLRTPQLSYKIYSPTEDSLTDYIVEMKCLTPDLSHATLPKPFTEVILDKQISQVDIWFKFEIEQQHQMGRPQTKHQSTSTYDEQVLNPIIDQLRDNVPEWNKLQQHLQPSAPMTHKRKYISLRKTTEDIPQHKKIHDRNPTPPRQRPHQRLGPPVTHEFTPRKPRDAPRHRPRSSHSGMKRARR